MRQAGFAGHRVEHLVGLLLVAGDRHLRLTVACDVEHLGPGIGGIDAHHLHADHLGAQVGIEPLREPFGRDDDAVAALQAELHQAQCGAACVAVIVGPGARAPDAVDLLAQRHLRAALQGMRAQQGRQRAFTANQLFVLKHGCPPRQGRPPARPGSQPLRPAFPARSGNRNPARTHGPKGPSPLACHVRSSAPRRRIHRGCPG
ncbi:hypothetical protein FQZ97_748150 [compost metagenome]